jgi:hypothetical protein
MCHFVAKYKILLYNKICLNVSERSTIHGLFSFVTLLYSFFKIVEGIYVYIYNYIYIQYTYILELTRYLRISRTWMQQGEYHQHRNGEPPTIRHPQKPWLSRGSTHIRLHMLYLLGVWGMIHFIHTQRLDMIQGRQKRSTNKKELCWQQWPRISNREEHA